MLSNPIEIPCFSLSPRVLSLYKSLENYSFSDRQRATFDNLKNNENQYNELSQHAVKRLRRSIYNLIYISNEKEIQGRQIISKNQEFTTEYEKADKYSKPVKHKLSMITLTLPAVQIHTDEQIKSTCLHHFLIEIQKQFNVVDYIWKAEKQENQNIHFHILINKYIHHAKIRIIWNRVLSKLGYISTYKQNMETFFKDGFKLSENKADRRTEQAQRKAYETGKSEIWSNPNSTDIHALYKVRNAGAYLTKYLAKGVTKSSRTDAIKKLRNEIEIKKARIDEIQKEVCFYSKNEPQAQHLQNEFNKLEIELSNNLNSLSELLKQGVTGRIWSQSQSLSKIKNYTEVCNWEDVPDIEIIDKTSESKFINTIGNRQIFTYLIEIEKHPSLKSRYDSHLLKMQNLLTPGQQCKIKK